MKKLALLVLALGLFAVSCGAKAEEAKPAEATTTEAAPAENKDAAADTNKESK